MKDEIILAIESSCDETAIAVLKNNKELLANVVSTQIPVHQKYGGVMPEIASRLHVENIGFVLQEALDESKIKLEDIILSETNLAMNINTKYSLIDIISGITISDEEGNVYNIYKTVDGNSYKLIFNIDNALDKQLYLNINIPEYKIFQKVELIKK